MSRPRRRSSSVSSTSVKRNGMAAPAPPVSSQTAPRPASEGQNGWRAYWTAQSQPWRTEPEIDAKRREELAQRRAIVPNIEKGVYPFKGMKLSRADVEWLLAMHEDGRGPVDWSDESQREREGLDLRGADLSQVDLSRLPLACLRGGLILGEWRNATEEQIEAAAIHLERANLQETRVEQGQFIGASMKGASLYKAHLEEVCLRNAHLEEVDLKHAYLEKAILLEAHLERSTLAAAHLERAGLIEAHLEGADLSVASLEDARCHNAHLEGAFLISAHLEGAQLQGAHLEWAVLYQAHLEHAFLEGANLEGTDLRRAHLEGANLSNAHFEGKNVPPEDLKRIQQCFQEYPLFDPKMNRPNWKNRPDFPAALPPADLHEAFFDSGTRLNEVVLGDEIHGYITVADVSWGGVNLAVLKAGLRELSMLGDEQKALQKKVEGVSKDKNQLLDEYEQAVRANRQLAVTLQGQGLNEEATRFAYRAQILQRRALGFQVGLHEANLKQRVQVLGAWLFSWFLFLLAGYGYKPGRSFLAYLLVIGAFLLLYLHLDSHLAWYEALVVSMTAFHGRGFSPSTFSPGDPLSIASAIEAFVGLIIEVTFIATLTQRFFNR